MMTDATRRKVNPGTLFVGSTFLIPGLAISGWSMFGYMRTSAHAPIWLCIGASAAFDGIGLFAAFKAHDFAARGLRARFAWTVVYAAVIASVFINWRHASTMAWPMGIHVLISAPAAAAAAAFELIMQETRETERAKHEARARTRQSVKIDLDIWFHHPFMVWAERRRESAERLRAALASQRDRDTVTAPVVTVTALPVAASAERDRVTAPVVTAAANGNGARHAVTAAPSVTRDAAPVVTDRPSDAALPSQRDRDAAVTLAAVTAAGDVTTGQARPEAQPVDRPVTSQRDTREMPADQGGELANVVTIGSAPTNVTDTVRRVFNPEWDTATIARVVISAHPDATDSTIRKAVSRVRREHADRSRDKGQAAAPGQYL